MFIAEKSENSQKKTMTFAMPGGLLFGLAVGEALAMTQILDKNLCISLSMLIGLWIGMALDRKNKHSDEH